MMDLHTHQKIQFLAFRSDMHGFHSQSLLMAHDGCKISSHYICIPDIGNKGDKRGKKDLPLHFKDAFLNDSYNHI